MLVFAPAITPRLQYCLRFLSDYYGHPFTATDDASVFAAAVGPRLNYSSQTFGTGTFRIAPHPLLFEEGIRPQSPGVFDHGLLKAFFRTEGDHPFDLLAATFYLLSRYEEYLPHQKDEYGRYAHTGSLAFRAGFLQRPLVNLWLEDFRGRLRQLGLPIPEGPPPFTFLPTYDIDIAWSYREKDWLRTGGGALRALLKRDTPALRQRWQVLQGGAPDPYDSFGWLEDLHRRHGLRPRYFFPVGRRRGRFDRHIHPGRPALRQLVRSLADRHPVGLHPTWASGDRRNGIAEEQAVLESILQAPVTFSRQHYLRFTLPQTFQRLLEAGISADYSMGYGTVNGFRASVCSPFYWYDLEREEQTPLRLHPFAFMDANAFYEQKLSPGEALEEMKKYYTEVRAVGGQLITIWHNHLLGTDPLFAGWRGTYAAFISAVAPER